jgi:hypothetical protein
MGFFTPRIEKWALLPEFAGVRVGSSIIQAGSSIIQVGSSIIQVGSSIIQVEFIDHPS